MAAAVLMAAMTASLLAGCGGSGSDDSAATEAPATDATEAPAADGADAEHGYGKHAIHGSGHGRGQAGQRTDRRKAAKKDFGHNKVHDAQREGEAGAP